MLIILLILHEASETGTSYLALGSRQLYVVALSSLIPKAKNEPIKSHFHSTHLLLIWMREKKL